MFGKGVLLVLLVLGAIAYQAQSFPSKYSVVMFIAVCSLRVFKWLL